MRRMATAMVLVGVCVAGGMTPAFADEAPDGVLEAIVADTAPARIQGDDLVAQVGDVRAEIPVDSEEPLTLQSGNGPEISITLPRGDGDEDEPAREGSGAVSHDLGDGSRIVPAIRSNGIVQILSVLHDAGAPTSFDYDVAVGTGGSLVAAADGGVRLLDAAGEEAASVAAPWAVDASGKQIPTHFVLGQNRLTQIVDTTSVVDVQYPVVADPAVSVTYYRYSAVNVSRTYNWTNKAIQLAICKVQSGASRGTCTMSAGYELETSVDTSFGLTRGFVSANIGVNESKKVTGNVSWTSPVAYAGSSYKAWAVGTRVTYRIQKWIGRKTLGMSTPRWTLDSTSSTLSAFEPQVGFAVGQ
ncbi:hypothetical protein [Microbacterium testaceum]|nr:hypothetical protein [Microbacterium testaceum]